MKNKKSKSKKIASTQKYLFLSNIRDDVLVFKNQGLRAVLMVSAVNFALKGEDEQQSIVQGYISLISRFSYPDFDAIKKAGH